MFKNYIKIALRNIWKNKAFSFINIVGLSIGLSAAFVIGVMIYYDATFDNFHPEGDRIYRVTTEFSTPEGKFYNPGVTVPLAQALRDLKMSELETVVPFLTAYPLHVENSESETVFKNPDFVIYADAEYFKTIKYTWLAGLENNVLHAPNEVVLSETRARKYFPDIELHSILGKTLVYNDSITTKVAGIVANIEARTDLVFEEFISLKTADHQDMTSAVQDGHWHTTNGASQLFVKLSENSEEVQVQKY